MNLTYQVKRIGVLSPPLPWDKPVVDDRNGQEVVVMLHGLWRSVRAMQPMARHLSVQGYTTVNLPYASFRRDLDELVNVVRAEVQPWIEQGKTIHFVTHSLGGVVVKRLLDLLEASQVENIGRVVMLAPPHRGSEIVDWLRNSPLRPIKSVLGPAGEFLSSERMAGSRQSEEFRAGVEAAVIMGEKSALPFFRKLLDASNDGIVSVEKGRLFGIKEFKVVNADHTFISSDLLVMKMVNDFIRTGTMENALVSD
ncbi:MAG: esterase/lipase family protein [Akkermansiaceae bacterium]